MIIDLDMATVVLEHERPEIQKWRKGRESTYVGFSLFPSDPRTILGGIP